MPRTDDATAALALATLDLTDLAEETSLEAALELSHRAASRGTAAVCLWPQYVAAASGALADSPVRVATVVNFPGGDQGAEITRTATELALADGADEIDVVLPWRAFVDGDLPDAAAVLDAVRDAVDAANAERTADGRARAEVKVIIESGMISDPESIADATWFAIDHGADFVKTSTGKTPISATPEAARAILEVLAEHAARGGRPVGFKASGGVRTVADAAMYLEIADTVMGPEWATPATFRFGASSLLNDIEQVLAL